ncbi:MAG: hypothetical protein CMM87_06665 [Rickettsiales bacterium]|nr:hypothetical protein [Rickettsiales bacterium]|tara:strand:+ start:101 stop:313 length:213 start_codon:yes stop_codon:yes gene_type:complete
MTVQINHHIVITDAEQQAIVNALAFYNANHTHEWNEHERVQWCLAFKEDNRGFDRDGPVDQLATKIANSN